MLLGGNKGNQEETLDVMTTNWLSGDNTDCQEENIARIAKRCPENITSVVKCVKFFFPKLL